MRYNANYPNPPDPQNLLQNHGKGLTTMSATIGPQDVIELVKVLDLYPEEDTTLQPGIKGVVLSIASRLGITMYHVQFIVRGQEISAYVPEDYLLLAQKASGETKNGIQPTSLLGGLIGYN